MKQELIQKICILLQKNNTYSDEMKNELVILLNDYDIQRRSTELAICDEDINKNLIARFLVSKTVAGCTKRTLDYYRITISNILEKIGKSGTEVTPDDIRMYLACRQIKDGISKTTASGEWRTLSTFYGYLQKEEIISKNPMFKVESIRPEKKKKKAFTDMEMEKIREGVDNVRDKALIEVLFSTWCRVTEIANMKIKDIDGDSMLVFGKGQKERVVYLNPKAKLAIENYLNTRTDDNEYLFVSRQKPYKKINQSGIEIVTRNLGKKLDIKNCHPHRFRRTGATMALRHGMPVEKVSKILGHEDIGTTQIYLDISEEELKQAHKKYAR